MLDFVINHSSNDNEWFLKSEMGTKTYDNYYIWKDAKNRDQYGNPVPPNNWVGGFSDSYVQIVKYLS